MSSRPLKLLFVINHLFPTGGAEIQLTHLAKGLAERGHDVTVCCIDSWSIDPHSLEASGVQLVALQAGTRLRRIAAMPRLTRLARRADVVQCTMWDASLWGRIAATLARRPVIVADHATDRSMQVSSRGAPRAGWIERHNRMLDRFTFATVACATSQWPVLVGEGIDADKIVHIPNGVPIGELRRAADRGLPRDSVGLPEHALVALHVGVFRQEKNQVGALEAVARAREEIPNIELVFVGTGATRQEVEARAGEMGATAWAHFLGVRGDVPALLGLADVMISPSRADAMPMTILEAMAVGTPIVATDVGDVAEMVDGAGIVVPPGDDRLFADALVHVLSDSQLRSELADAGRKQVRRFDSFAMVESYAALFEAAVSGTTPRSTPVVVP